MFPVKPIEIYHPQFLVWPGWFPRIWTFKCGKCTEKVSKFGMGIIECPYCKTVNALRWCYHSTGM